MWQSCVLCIATGNVIFGIAYADVRVHALTRVVVGIAVGQVYGSRGRADTARVELNYSGQEATWKHADQGHYHLTVQGVCVVRRLQCGGVKGSACAKQVRQQAKQLTGDSPQQQHTSMKTKKYYGTVWARIGRVGSKRAFGAFIDHST
jgi:hypothetical protein